MLSLVVINKEECQQFEHNTGPIELGREPARQGVPRCVIQDPYVSKDHMRIEELEDSAVRIENRSSRNSIYLSDKSIISVGEMQVIEPPIRIQIRIGETLIDLEHHPLGEMHRGDSVEEVRVDGSTLSLEELECWLQGFIGLPGSVGRDKPKRFRVVDVIVNGNGTWEAVLCDRLCPDVVWTVMWGLEGTIFSDCGMVGWEILAPYCNPVKSD